jgi:hypothetical protein
LRGRDVAAFVIETVQGVFAVTQTWTTQ